MGTKLFALIFLVAVAVQAQNDPIHPTDGKNGTTPSGLPVDKTGGPTVDPTRNVLDLVGAAVKRLDDLRETDARASSSLSDLALKRLDDLRAAESRRVDEELKMRSDFDEKLSLAEASRINAIRAVDVNAVAVASERATQQATVLANQVTASADNLRTLVATSAATLAEQQRNSTTQINDRLSALEKTQYESKGRSNVADPQLERNNALLEKLVNEQAAGGGRSESISNIWTVGVAGAGLLVAIAVLWRSNQNGRYLQKSKTGP
jgi:hypothetical protein